MNVYADANLLVAFYLQLPGWDSAYAMLYEKKARASWPLPVTDLLRFEVENGIQRMVFESRTNGQWRVTPESAAVGQANFVEHLEDEVFLQRVPLTLADIEPEFTSLAARYTARHGFRTYDIMHVASAITLKCGRFLSFDAKANALAKLAGLKTC